MTSLPVPTLSLPVAADTDPPVLWGIDQLRAAAGPRTSWLWQGYLAPGATKIGRAHV